MDPKTVEASLGVARHALHIESENQAPAPPTQSAASLQSTRTASSPWRTEIEPDARGQFLVDMTVNGVTLDAMVDTGASFVTLSYQAAEHIGLHPNAEDFKYVMQTANGSTRAAAAVVRLIRVGNVEAHDVQVFISQPGALTTHNLLGMSFLKKLSGYQVDAGRLVLKQ